MSYIIGALYIIKLNMRPISGEKVGVRLETKPADVEKPVGVKKLADTEEPVSIEDLAIVEEPINKKEYISKEKLIIIYYKYKY